MQHILVYADSLSGALCPPPANGWPFEQRWPGGDGTGPVPQASPSQIEDCSKRAAQRGRPFGPGRNGRAGLAQRIEIHSPLALVVLDAGTNDFQSMHPHNAWMHAQGIAHSSPPSAPRPSSPACPVPHSGWHRPPSKHPRGPI